METQPKAQLDAGFLSGPILPPLIRFSLPLMLSLLLQALYGGVDLAVVGWFSTTAHVSAVATGSQMMQAVTVVITGLTMGVTVLLGHAMGAGDPKTAGDVTAAQIWLFLPLALFCALLMISLAPWLTQLMQVPAAAVDATIAYIRICAGGTIFITAYNVISGLFRGIGNSRSPFLFVLIACLVNVVLDLVFVGVFSMGAGGAALATVLAQAASVAFSLAYLHRHPFPFPVGKANLRAPGVPKGILRVGGPIALQELLVHISFLIITSIVNGLGLVASAGIGISEKLFVFLSIAPSAFMSASVNVLCAFIGTDGEIFQPCPRSLAAHEALFTLRVAGSPGTAIPPFPFSPVKFSGLIERVSASDRVARFPRFMPSPLKSYCCARAVIEDNPPTSAAVRMCFSFMFICCFNVQCPSFSTLPGGFCVTA